MQYPGPERAAGVEVSDLDSPVLVDQQIEGLEVSVQHAGLVHVQLQHALHSDLFTEWLPVGVLGVMVSARGSKSALVAASAALKAMNLYLLHERFCRQ